MTEETSKHYDAEYFDWQSSMGEFGGWADQTKFEGDISEDNVVLDFGCGGGFLLKRLNCRRKIGVEINPTARETAKSNGVEVYSCVEEVPDGSVDVVISNHALEHTQRPLDKLIMLNDKLKPNGRIVLVVPCETISCSYKAGDVNRHLYTWNPMCLGNLLVEAGYSQVKSEAYIHKWPPKWRFIAKIGGRSFFDVVCRIYGRVERSNFQVRASAVKKD